MTEKHLTREAQQPSLKTTVNLAATFVRLQRTVVRGSKLMLQKSNGGCMRNKLDQYRLMEAEILSAQASLFGSAELTEAQRRSGIATEEDCARIELWASHLPHQRFMVEEEKLGDIAQARIMDNLERYGICLIRPVGLPATREVVESLIHMIGTPSSSQNEYSASIKDIRPRSNVNPNTGDAKGDLGFHVDGTQQPKQPAVLLFQYATGAVLGAHSKFIDCAKIIHDLPLQCRINVLASLARSDAAVFAKGSHCFQGPIFSLSETGALICRIRFDEVITVNPSYHEQFALLKAAFEDTYYPVVFQPRDGDIVLFDNWRIMHARTQVHGMRERHHRRVWFNYLKLEHQPRYYLDIRPVSHEVATLIRLANRIREQ
jgi:hypothetical protein